jgi:superfamily II DNA helicase RecQ
MEDLTQRFAQVRDAWLCKATYSPMGYILSLLLFGKKIARETGSRLMVSWSKQGEMMYFMGKPILMEDLRTMVASMTADAEDLLWGQLMFKEGDDERFVIPLAGIEDDLTQTRRGQSFIHRNGLAGKEVEMLKDLVASSRKTDLLDQMGEWKWAGIRKYLKLVKRFEEFLLLLAHITGGQPSRGEEITGLRLVNGINRDRNVFIIDGEVVLVTQYHKSLAHFDSPKVIPRFLPGRIGQLFVIYMIYIRPLTDRWEADRWELYGEKMAPPSDFIWHNEAAGGAPWESSQMSGAMGRWTSYYIGRRIMLQDWRHIAIAISKKHARDRGAARADFEDGEDDYDESEQYEVPDDLAASHTGQTAANYGVTIDVLKRLTAESLEIFGQVSRRWHRFLGCDISPSLLSSSSSSLLSSSSGKKVEPIPIQVREAKEGHPPRKRAKAISLETLRAGITGAEEKKEEDMIIRALQAVLRNNSARFRSPQQEEAVRLAAAKQSPLVAVLPTGGGKSLVFMVPAMLASAGITIVVAPYAELKRQLVQRCVDAGLDCKPWPEARSSWPRVTLVSAEAAITDDFLQWAADLSVNGRLDRVVIDECHLSFTAAETYRSKLRGLVLLRSLGCPFVFLTGTLPPLRQRDFEEAMQLQAPLYIRASSHRLNVRYAVLRVRNGRGVMEVKRRVEARLPHLSAGEKGIIYCTSQAKCKALARQLGCHYYHALRDNSDSQFIAQREEGFQAWLRGEAPYIVATAALGTGIDVAGIIHVIHLEAPFSIIDYAQEAGRAGRTGEPVTAEVIIEDKDWPDEDTEGEACLDISVREVRRLIRTQGCRRRLLGQCLDGDLRDCKDLGGGGGGDEVKATRCDNCHRNELLWKSELSSQGIIASNTRGRQDAHALEALEAALEEVEGLGKMGCRICWMFDGVEEARHTWDSCSSTAGTKDLSFSSCMDFQGLINYRKDRQASFLSCFYCHVSQELCRDGYKTKGASCWRWKHAVIPMALAATTEPDLWLQIQEAAGRDFKGRHDYGDWLGRKHSKLVCGREMTNAMAVLTIILGWRQDNLRGR